jgi:hypothetical protein
MTTEKFFTYIQRLNSLIPAAALALVLVLLGVDMIQTRNRNKASTIELPTPAKDKTQNTNKLDFRIKPTSLESEDNILILKVVTDTQGGRHDRYGEETRNLLFIKPSKEKAEWLFPDQTQALIEIYGLSDGSSQGRAIYAEVVDRKQESETPKNSPSSVYLISGDGSRLEKVIKEADSILSHDRKGSQLHIVYQRDQQIRAARISLTDFATQSDRLVVSMTSVPGK